MRFLRSLRPPVSGSLGERFGLVGDSDAGRVVCIPALFASRVYFADAWEDAQICVNCANGLVSQHGQAQQKPGGSAAGAGKRVSRR